MNISDITTKIAVPIIAAVLSGLGVVIITPDWEEQARSKGWVSLSEWQTSARRSEWLPKNECPAYPIKMEIFAPGNGTVLDNIYLSARETTIFHEILVRLNRPLTGNSDVGFVYNLEGSNVFYIDLPYMEKMKSETVLAKKNLFKIPQKIKSNSNLKIWSILAEKGNLLESRFSSIEQISALKEVTYISNPITVKISPQ